MIEYAQQLVSEGITDHFQSAKLQRFEDDGATLLEATEFYLFLKNEVTFHTFIAARQMDELWSNIRGSDNRWTWTLNLHMRLKMSLPELNNDRNKPLNWMGVLRDRICQAYDVNPFISDDSDRVVMSQDDQQRLANYHQLDKLLLYNEWAMPLFLIPTLSLNIAVLSESNPVIQPSRSAS